MLADWLYAAAVTLSIFLLGCLAGGLLAAWWERRHLAQRRERATLRLQEDIAALDWDWTPVPDVAHDRPAAVVVVAISEVLHPSDAEAVQAAVDRMQVAPGAAA